MLKKESPTMNRIGRSFITLIAVTKGWKLFSADVTDAFLQGIDLKDVGVVITGVPNADMRRRLSRLMRLKDDEELDMLKSGFGDARAPRLWFDSQAAAALSVGLSSTLLTTVCF